MTVPLMLARSLMCRTIVLPAYIMLMTPMRSDKPSILMTFFLGHE